MRNNVKAKTREEWDDRYHGKDYKEAHDARGNTDGTARNTTLS